MRNFKFFPANVAIGRTNKGEQVFATPELLKALEIVKDALDSVDTPTIQAQDPAAVTDFPAPQIPTISEALTAVAVASNTAVTEALSAVTVPSNATVPEALPAVSVPNLAAGETAWPIGSVFVGAVATNPATLLGFGVWTAIGAGQFPVGFLAGDPDFGTLGGTGGAKTKAISAHAGSAVADHADHTHSVTSNVTATTSTFGAGANTAVTSITNNAVTSGGASGGFAHSVTQPNNHTDLNVLPPYLVLNFWQRTA